MTKFARTVTPPRSPVQTAPARAYTYEGHVGYERKAKSELFLLAVSNMVSEESFYETGADADARFRRLVHMVTAEDPEWVARFVPYLRDTMQMRSASVVMAAEYVKAGAPNGRRVVDAALSRADEPAEILAYWSQKYGRAFPQPLKRGVADAVRRLYNERAALKYDGSSRAWRMGDVVELVHPKPAATWQSDLFRFLLDARHGRFGDYALPTINRNRELLAMPTERRRPTMLATGADTLAEAGLTWEALSGWLQGPMDAEAWEAAIPSMGYMALLRNLRNFEQAGISDAATAHVTARLSDPEQVERSRQFPIRFYSAWKQQSSFKWASPLEAALNHSLRNVPKMPGRSLVLIDVSGSMKGAALSRRSSLTRDEVSGLFGVAFARAQEKGTVDVFAYDMNIWQVDVWRSPVLENVRQLQAIGGGGTATMQTLAHVYDGHDRVLIVTDEQAHAGPEPALGPKTMLYTFNVGGYRTAQVAQGRDNSYVFGGLTDAGFQVVPILERRRDVGWPF